MCELVPSVTIYGTTQISTTAPTTLFSTRVTTLDPQIRLTTENAPGGTCSPDSNNCQSGKVTGVITTTPTSTIISTITSDITTIITSVVPQKTLYYPCSSASTSTAESALTTDNGISQTSAIFQASSSPIDQTQQKSTSGGLVSNTANSPSSSTSPPSQLITASTTGNDTSELSGQAGTGDATSSSDQSGSGSHTSQPSVPAIAGGVGAAMGALLLLILCLYCRRRNTSKLRYRYRNDGNDVRSSGVETDFWERRFRQLEAEVESPSKEKCDEGSGLNRVPSKKIRLTLDLASKDIPVGSTPGTGSGSGHGSGSRIRPTSTISAISSYFKGKNRRDHRQPFRASPSDLTTALNFSRPRFGHGPGHGHIRQSSSSATETDKRSIKSHKTQGSIKSLSTWLNHGAPSSDSLVSNLKKKSNSVQTGYTLGSYYTPLNQGQTSHSQGDPPIPVAAERNRPGGDLAVNEDEDSAKNRRSRQGGSYLDLEKQFQAADQSATPPVEPEPEVLDGSYDPNAPGGSLPQAALRQLYPPRYTAVMNADKAKARAKAQTQAESYTVDANGEPGPGVDADAGSVDGHSNASNGFLTLDYAMKDAFISTGVGSRGSDQENDNITMVTGAEPVSSSSRYTYPPSLSERTEEPCIGPCSSAPSGSGSGSGSRFTMTTMTMESLNLPMMSVQTSMAAAPSITSHGPYAGQSQIHDSYPGVETPPRGLTFREMIQRRTPGLNPDRRSSRVLSSSTLSVTPFTVRDDLSGDAEPETASAYAWTETEPSISASRPATREFTSTAPAPAPLPAHPTPTLQSFMPEGSHPHSTATADVSVSFNDGVNPLGSSRDSLVPPVPVLPPQSQVTPHRRTSTGYDRAMAASRASSILLDPRTATRPSSTLTTITTTREQEDHSTVTMPTGKHNKGQEAGSRHDNDDDDDPVPSRPRVSASTSTHLSTTIGSPDTDLRFNLDAVSCSSDHPLRSPRVRSSHETFGAIMPSQGGNNPSRRPQSSSNAEPTSPGSYITSSSSLGL